MISKGSSSVVVDPSVVSLTTSELFVRSRTLPFGIYRLTLTVTLNVSSNVTTSSKSAFVQINPSGITANLVPLGTSMITLGEEQDLHLNPGLYFVDLDEDQFNASVNPPLVSLFRLVNSRIGFTNIIVVFMACRICRIFKVFWFPWMIRVVRTLGILRVWTIEQIENWNWSLLHGLIV